MEPWTIKIKRIYDHPSDNDGYRILVDRLWPRGVSKEEANLDEWMKEIAPSGDLREWYDHDPEKFEEFRLRYFKELEEKQELVKRVFDKANESKITLLYAAKDKKHNNAVVLKEYLQNQ